MLLAFRDFCQWYTPDGLLLSNHLSQQTLCDSPHAVMQKYVESLLLYSRLLCLSNASVIVFRKDAIAPRCTYRRRTTPPRGNVVPSWRRRSMLGRSMGGALPTWGCDSPSQSHLHWSGIRRRMFGRLPRALPGNIATTANTATNKYLKHSIYTDLTMNLFLKPTKESCKAFTHWFILYIKVFKRVLNVIALSFFFFFFVCCCWWRMMDDD